MKWNNITLPVYRNKNSYKYNHKDLQYLIHSTNTSKKYIFEVPPLRSVFFSMRLFNSLLVILSLKLIIVLIEKYRMI